MTYFISYTTATDNNTVLVEQSRPYTNLARARNHLRNTGFIWSGDLTCWVNPELNALAAIKFEEGRQPQSITKKEIFVGNVKRPVVKVTVNL